MRVQAGTRVGKVAIYNRQDNADYQPWMGTVDVYVGSSAGDVTSSAVRCGSATHKRMNSRACPLNKAVLREKAARAAAFAGGSAGGDDAISMLLSPASAAASASSSSSSSARWPSTNAAGELYYRRPAGRPPNGKAWNSASGVWVMKDPNGE